MFRNCWVQADMGLSQLWMPAIRLGRWPNVFLLLVSAFSVLPFNCYGSFRGREMIVYITGINGWTIMLGSHYPWLTCSDSHAIRKIYIKMEFRVDCADDPLILLFFSSSSQLFQLTQLFVSTGNRHFFRNLFRVNISWNMGETKQLISGRGPIPYRGRFVFEPRQLQKRWGWNVILLNFNVVQKNNNCLEM